MKPPGDNVEVDGINFEEVNFGGVGVNFAGCPYLHFGITVLFVDDFYKKI